MSIVTWGQEGIIVTIAGNGTNMHGGDGGPASAASFVYPECICLDRFGNLYIVDVLGHRLRKIALSTRIITTVAGNGIGGFSGDGGQATAAQVWGPQGICTDTAGNIYFGDVLNRRVRKITVSTGIITTIAGNGSMGYSGDGGSATNARFHYPTGLLIDNAGNLLVSDIGTHTVRKITAAGIVSTIVGIGSAGYSGDNGSATNALLNQPAEIAMDSRDNLFIADHLNNVVRKIDAISGVITTVAGTGTAGSYGDGGPATAATIIQPYGIFIDKSDDVFIADYYGASIRKITSSTGIIHKAVGCGIDGFDGDGGPATNAKLKPSTLCIDSIGTMYVADFLNYRIRMVYNPKLGTPTTNFINSEILLYPNPASDDLTIENAGGRELCIYSIVGKFFGKYKLIHEKEVIDIRHLCGGLYVVQIIEANGDKWVRKVVKQP